jgi:hypothetical protein
LDLSEVNISFGFSDILAVLTINNSVFKEGVTPLISKIIIINENYEVNLYTLSKLLKAMGINELHLFSINNLDLDEPQIFKIDIDLCFINYIEISESKFREFLNNPN